MSNDQVRSPKQDMSKVVRGAIYIAIGALVLAAIVCVAWVFVPDQGDLIGRAFLTVLLLSGFSGAVLLDANLAARRPDWLVLASTASWVVVLIVGAFKIWIPRGDDEFFGWTGVRVWELLLVIGVLQLALVHQRLYWKAHRRYVTGFTRTIAVVTTVLLVGLVLMLAFYLAAPRLLDYSDWYWRVVVALAILASVGTLILPLLNALFAPRPVPAQPAPFPVPPAQGRPDGRLPWPTFADGRTPLPFLPNGQPDFDAARTGVPSPGARMWGAQPGAAPAQPVMPAQAAGAAQPGAAPMRPAPAQTIPPRPQPPVPGRQPAPGSPQPPAPPAI